jgi:hypothetical protein
MHTRRFYMMKADDCLTTAAWSGDAADRLALLRIAQSYMLLADYVSGQDEQGTGQSENGRGASQARQRS